MAHKDRDFQAAEVMAEAAGEARLSGSVLIVDEPTGVVGQSLGADVTPWTRRAGAPTLASAMPPGGPFEAAIIRMPKSTEELKFTIALVAERLAPEGRLFVFGPNDEGIRSAPKGFQTLFEKPASILTKRHCRVWSAAKDLKATPPVVESFREVVSVETSAGPLSWSSWPGMFAHRRLDAGSAFLIDHLEGLELAPGARVLDYGCGAGVLSLAVQKLFETPSLTLFDNDALALETALKNVPEASGVCGTNLNNLGEESYDLILSNPPIHTGKSQTFAILERLVAGAPDHLSKRGRLRLVVQGTVPVRRMMEPYFKTIAVVAESKSFVIWDAQV